MIFGCRNTGPVIQFTLAVVVGSAMCACATRDYELMPFVPLQGGCVVHQKIPAEYGDPFFPNAKGILRGLTPDEEYSLSPEQIRDLKNRAKVSHDSTAAYRLAFYYALSCGNRQACLGWYAVAAEMGGLKQAVKSLQAVRSNPDRSAVSDAFGLTDGQLRNLQRRAKDSKAAFRLALYYGFVVTDEQLMKQWLATSAALGSKGAAEYLEILNGTGK